MKNFTFHNPTKLYFGRDTIKKLDEAVPRVGKILMMYGGGSIKQNGVYEQVKAALGAREVIEFGGVEPNPLYETLVPAIDLCRKEGVDFILAVGGGSVADGAKFVAISVAYDGDPWDILCDGVRPPSALPLGVVLTLPATGTEMNGNSVISRRETQEKLAFGCAQVFPKFSILDPVTTFSLPPRQVANGIVDSFVHVMEQYLTYPEEAPLQDRFAESILQTLIEEGPKTMANPTDYASRANLVWCSTMALNTLIGMGVPQDWATHVIGHELTALYDIDHARTLAVVLPSLMKIQSVGKRSKLLQYAARVWGIEEKDEDRAVALAIDKTAGFFESLGMPSRLSGYAEVRPDTPAIVARRLADREALPLGERDDLWADGVERILSDSLGLAA